MHATGVVACFILLVVNRIALADSGPMNFIGKWQTDPGGTLGESDGLSWHSTNGNWIAVSDNRTATRLYDIAGFPSGTPTTVRTFTHDPTFVLPSPLRQVARGEVNPISFSPDGNWMATGVDNLGAKIWNVNTGTQMQHLGNGTNTDGASFSPTGQYFAYGSDSNLIVRAFNTATGLANAGSTLLNFNFGSGEVNSVDFSPNGQYVVGVGGVDSGMVRVFRTSDWGLQSSYANTGTPNISIKSVAFSPDSQLIAYGARDKRARVIDINGNLVKDLPHQSSHTFYSTDDNDTSAANESLDWTADGKYLVTGGLTDGIARVWRREDWSLVGWARAQDPGPDALNATPKGRAVEAVHIDANNRVAISGDEGTTYIYQFNNPVEKGHFQPTGGANIVIEAENHDGTVAQGFITGTLNAQEWTQFSNAQASGGESLQVANAGMLRDTNFQTYDPTKDAPKIDYLIDFAETGTYFVWARGMGNDSGNSIHVGLDGFGVGTAEKLQFGDSGTATWLWTSLNRDGNRATLNVSSIGLHTLNVWMREDGVMLDKLILTKDSNFVPTGVGPLETLRAVPEPASAVLLLAGAAGLLMWRRKERC